MLFSNLTFSFCFQDYFFNGNIVIYWYVLSDMIFFSWGNLEINTHTLNHLNFH